VGPECGCNDGCTVGKVKGCPLGEDEGLHLGCLEGQTDG